MNDEIYRKIKASSKKASYRYSRKDKAEIQLLCTKLDHITILEGPDRFWVYDEDVATLSELFGFEVYETKKGFTLVYKKPMHDGIISALTAQGVNCVIVFPDTFTQILPTKTTLPEGKTLKESDYFSLEEQDGPIHRFVIKSDVKSERVVITHTADGTREIINVPLLVDPSDPDVIVLSPFAPLARLVIGKHVGETISCSGIKYTIVEIGKQE